MTRKPCSRLWQIEAVRDGRLAGNDLSNALRHRVECADCNQEARALSELTRRIMALPVQPAAPLQQRRARQALLGSWNEHLLMAQKPRTRLRVALVVAFCAIGALALAVGYPLVRGGSRSSERRPLFFEVVTKPSTQAEPSLDASAASATAAAEPAITKPSPNPPSAKRRVAQPRPQPSAAQPATAEDDAYLHIIDLLRNGHESEARSKASQYLERFPDGFRRHEVANIARR